jgi:DNA-binding transcriptional ArsR family regulator
MGRDLLGMEGPDADPTELDRVFAALADPTRRAMLMRLLEGEASVGDLAEPHAMSLAAISKHVAILARAGLVSQVPVGRARICRLEPDGIRAAAVWMQGFGAIDLGDLAALEWLVEQGLSEPDADP